MMTKKKFKSGRDENERTNPSEKIITKKEKGKKSYYAE
jgi:hypothetical protein